MEPKPQIHRDHWEDGGYSSVDNLVHRIGRPLAGGFPASGIRQNGRVGLFRKHQADVLFDPAQVDVVALTESADTVELFIVQDEPWTGSDAQLQSFRDKVQTYISYAVDGQMTAAYPETHGLPWRIVLHAQSGPPDRRTADVIAALSARLPEHGGGFEARLGPAR